MNNSRFYQRNKLINKLYDPERRNGGVLARRFGISRARIYQVLRKETNIMAGAEKKYGGRLPTIPIEPEKEAAIRAIADSMGVSIATIMRWGVDHLIHTYGGRVAGKAQAIEIPEFDPEISKPTF